MTRGSASPEPFRVCTCSGLPLASLRKRMFMRRAWKASKLLHELMVAQGALLACHARHRAGNPAAHNNLAAQILTGMTSAQLHQIAEDKLQEIDEYAATTHGKDTWTAWLEKVGASLSTSIAQPPLACGRRGCRALIDGRDLVSTEAACR